MALTTVTGAHTAAEADGSHQLELSDGSIATVPADKVPLVIQALQGALVERVFSQSQHLRGPTDTSLALIELHLLNARPAHKGLETNLSCNLCQLGWVSVIADNNHLRQLRDTIDRVLRDRSGSSAQN